MQAVALSQVRCHYWCTAQSETICNVITTSSQQFQCTSSMCSVYVYKLERVLMRSSPCRTCMIAAAAGTYCTSFYRRRCPDGEACVAALLMSPMKDRKQCYPVSSQVPAQLGINELWLARSPSLPHLEPPVNYDFETLTSSLSGGLSVCSHVASELPTCDVAAWQRGSKKTQEMTVILQLAHLHGTPASSKTSRTYSPRPLMPGLRV